jgi:hypothetical protein
LKSDSIPIENKVISPKSVLKEIIDTNITVVTTKQIESNVTVTKRVNKGQEEKTREPVEVIENVFSDELYFERDKVHENKYLMVIKHLDALALEKDALKVMYRKNMNIWSKKQSKDFKHIMEKNQYFSLCSDKRYWDNLVFEEQLVEKEILQSILLLKYLTNLKYGCKKWVESNNKIKDENHKKEMNYYHILSLLPHDVLMEKVVQMFLPVEERFLFKLDEYRSLLASTTNKSDLKEKRLELERLKVLKQEPNYINREEK